MSEQIIDIIKFDNKHCTRLAGISNLITAEAKYHLSCFNAFKRSRDKTKSEMKETDLALVWLSKELKFLHFLFGATRLQLLKTLFTG